MLAAVLFAVVALSDFVDGRIARRLGAQSAAGRVLDHAADIIFILAAFGLYVGLGIVPWWVPASIAAAFAVYVRRLAAAQRRAAVADRQPPRPPRRRVQLRADRRAGRQRDARARLAAALASCRALFALVPIYSVASIVTRSCRDRWRSGRVSS